MPQSKSSQKWILIAIVIIVFLLIGLIIYLLTGGGSSQLTIAPPIAAPTTQAAVRPQPGGPTVAPSSSAIKVGWLVSQYIANSHDYGAGYHDHVTAIHPRFVDPSIELFALVEPDSLGNAAQRDIISRYFLPDHTLILTDPAAAKVNVIVISRAFVLKTEDAQAIDQAVKNGTGLLIHVGLNRFEDFTDPDSELMQIDKPDSFWMRAALPCQVVSDDPLLSGLKSALPDGRLTIANMNGTTGVVHGTPLIVAEQSFSPPSSEPATTQPARQLVPLYIAQLGKGKIINCQWDSLPPQLVEASKGRFYIHCCEYLAGRKLD